MPRQLFAVDDKFPDVVAELEARGWQRLPIVKCPKFDLKWTNYTKIAWKRVQAHQIVNHLHHSVLLSQKDQLAQILYNRQSQGQLQVDKCFPRTFNLQNSDEMHQIKFWVHYSEAVALLKKSLVASGAIDEAQIQSALKFIKAITSIKNFFESWRMERALHELVTTQDAAASPKLRLLSGKSRREIVEILRELEQRDPQFPTIASAGFTVWICKPSNLSQGRGIVLCKSLDELAKVTWNDTKDVKRSGEAFKESSKQTKWMVQKYIDQPLLLQSGHKFDLRQWVLLTELEPDPRAFWFDKCYLRFCSRRFQLNQVHDSFMHLSNYSVQQHYVKEATKSSTPTNKHEHVDAFELMWSSEQLQTTLRQEYGRDVWSQTILPQMQSIVRLTLNAVLPKLQAVGRGFEWLGYDFLVDQHFHVWLLEVNVSPDVSHSTKITAELVTRATADALNVILDPKTLRSRDNGWRPFALESSQ